MFRKLAAVYNIRKAATLRTEWSIVFYAFAFFYIPHDAFAGSSMASAICTVVGIAQSEVGRGVSSLAIIVLGIGAMLGKTSWTLALTIAVGIAVLFGAQGIASLIGAGGGC